MGKIEFSKECPRIYGALKHMKARCYNNKNKDYKYYGGKGIKVCKEWKENSNLFIKWSLENGYKEGLTIDRIDGSGNYEPSNCRWATWEQQENNRCNNIIIEYNGEEKTLSQWCRELDLNYSTVYNRLNNYNFSIEDAFGKKIGKNIEYNGKTKMLIQWCKDLGLNYSTVKARLNKYGWTIEKAFEK